MSNFQMHKLYEQENIITNQQDGLAKKYQAQRADKWATGAEQHRRQGQNHAYV